MAVYQAGQTPTFLAQIKNVETGRYLLPIEIESATYTIEQSSVSYGRNSTGESVEYHTNQSIPLTAFLESPVLSNQWTADENGYNFKFSPDTRIFPAFEYPGEYTITFRVLPVIGNPIVWKRTLKFE